MRLKFHILSPDADVLLQSAAGINLRGFSAAAIGKRFMAQIAVDTTAAAEKAMKVVAKL